MMIEAVVSVASPQPQSGADIRTLMTACGQSSTTRRSEHRPRFNGCQTIGWHRPPLHVTRGMVGRAGALHPLLARLEHEPAPRARHDASRYAGRVAGANASNRYTVQSFSIRVCRRNLTSVDIPKPWSDDLSGRARANSRPRLSRKLQ